MADYWQHWLDMGKVLGEKAPKIFNVNWFRTDDEAWVRRLAGFLGDLAHLREP